MNSEHEYPPEGTYTREELEAARRSRAREVADAFASGERADFQEQQRRQFRELSRSAHARRT